MIGPWTLGPNDFKKHNLAPKPKEVTLQNSTSSPCFAKNYRFCVRVSRVLRFWAKLYSGKKVKERVLLVIGYPRRVLGKFWEVLKVQGLPTIVRKQITRIYEISNVCVLIRNSFKFLILRAFFSRENFQEFLPRTRNSLFSSHELLILVPLLTLERGQNHFDFRISSFWWTMEVMLSSDSCVTRKFKSQK